MNLYFHRFSFKVLSDKEIPLSVKNGCWQWGNTYSSYFRHPDGQRDGEKDISSDVCVDRP